MASVVTVFGATSQLGSKVSRTLAQEYHVRAVTRDPNSPKAKALCGPGIQLVKADVSDCRSIEKALENVLGCFVLTHSDNSCAEAYDLEVKQGKVIADACAKMGVAHVVYSTQLSVVKALGIGARHMDAKAQVEEYMKQSGLPLTGVILPVFYENFLTPPLRPRRVDSDFYELENVMGSTPLDMISIEDVGEVVKQIFRNRQQYLHKTLNICGDKQTMREASAIFTQHLYPKRVKNKPITLQQLRSVTVAGAEDLAAMFDFYCRVDQRSNLDLTRRLNGGCLSFDQWVRAQNDRIVEALDYPVTPAQQWMCL